MKKRILIPLMLCLLLCACTQTEARETTQPPQTETTGSERQLAPDFTVYDREGKPVKLSDFRGKPVVLNFWASWCGPCQSEMPNFEEAYTRYSEQIHFVMVNLTDEISGAEADTDYCFPVYFDTDTEAAYAYGIQSIPTTFFIDRQGYPVAYYTGAMDAKLLGKGIAMLLPQSE